MVFAWTRAVAEDRLASPLHHQRKRIMSLYPKPDILVTDPKPGVRLLTLNRPETRNALNTQFLEIIVGELDRARDDDAVRCVVITGAGKSFAAGADLAEMAKATTITAVFDRRPRQWDAMRRFPKPLIAAVNGFALGAGSELALIADIAVAGATAKLGQIEVSLGLIPGAGGSQRLVHRIGQAMAMKLILTGEVLSGADAAALRFVAESVADDRVVERALEIAEVIASKAPLAVRLAKELVMAAPHLPLETGILYERKAFATLFSTEDFKEGVAAAQEKRKPKFHGR